MRNHPPLILGIISGLISSLLGWIILNFFLTPSIETDNQIQHGKRKKYIRIYNKSRFNVYEVICYIEYKYADGSNYFRTDRTMPCLAKKDGEYKVILTGRSPENSKKDQSVMDFFEQTKGEIVVTVTYQNRFGIKKTTKPIPFTYTNDEKA